MAFSQARFSVFSGGQTGAGIFCMYDGSGSAAEGGDDAGTIASSGFLNSQEVKDLVAQGLDGRTLGQGIPCLIRGSDEIEFNLIYPLGNGNIAGATGAWQIT